MADETDETPDRAAILERRRRLVTRDLTELGVPTTRASTRRVGALALTLSGLATACPCLKFANPRPDEGTTGTEGMPKTESTTGTESTTESESESESETEDTTETETGPEPQ